MKGIVLNDGVRIEAGKLPAAKAIGVEGINLSKVTDATVAGNALAGYALAATSSVTLQLTGNNTGAFKNTKATGKTITVKPVPVDGKIAKEAFAYASGITVDLFDKKINGVEATAFTGFDTKNNQGSLLCRRRQQGHLCYQTGQCETHYHSQSCWR